MSFYIFNNRIGVYLGDRLPGFDHRHNNLTAVQARKRNKIQLL